MLKENRQLVPCGKCDACLKKHRLEWFVRCYFELKNSQNAWFITMTYADEHLPYDEVSGVPTLLKRDVQLFFKKLRQNLGVKFKYYLVGEYGGKTERPHYHLLLFNADPDIKELTIQLYKSWTYGFIDVKVVKESGINYVLDYIINRFDDVHDFRQSPFALMSKRPPIGNSYYEDENGKETEKVRWHRRDNTRFYVPINGIKYPLPRLYKERIYNGYARKKFAAEMEKQWLDKCVIQMEKDGDGHAGLEHDRKVKFSRTIRKKGKIRKL